MAACTDSLAPLSPVRFLFPLLSPLLLSCSQCFSSARVVLGARGGTLSSRVSNGPPSSNLSTSWGLESKPKISWVLLAQPPSGSRFLGPYGGGGSTAMDAMVYPGVCEIQTHSWLTSVPPLPRGLLASLPWATTEGWYLDLVISLSPFSPNML